MCTHFSDFLSRQLDEPTRYSILTPCVENHLTAFVHGERLFLTLDLIVNVSITSFLSLHLSFYLVVLS